jgi:transcriptional regulator with XRE-family HTH domain
MIELLEKLELYRLENKISQIKLAQRLGVSTNTVNRWFTGRNKPNKIQTYHIKKLLGIHKLKDKHFEIT